MGTEPAACYRCHRPLDDDDFSAGRALKVGSLSTCLDCAEGLLSRLTADQRKAILAKYEAALAERKSSSARRQMAEAVTSRQAVSFPRPRLPQEPGLPGGAPGRRPAVAIAAAGVGALVLVFIAVILAGGGRNGKPEDAAAPASPAAAPTPEAERRKAEAEAREGDALEAEVRDLLLKDEFRKARERVESSRARHAGDVWKNAVDRLALEVRVAADARFEPLKGRFLDAWRVGLLDDARALREEAAARCGPEAAAKLDEAGRASPHGLVGWWKLDENAGTAAADASGNGNDGKLVDGAAWAGGRVGASVAFDGKKSGVVCGAKNLPAANAPQTFACWVWYPSIPDRSDMQCFLTLTNEQEKSGVQVGICKDRLRAWAYGGKVFLAECRLAPARVWHHVAYTFDGSTHQLYVDGFSQASTTAAPQTAVPTRLELGRWWGPWDDKDWYEVLDGRMDDVRLYARAFSQEEIGRLVAAAR
jgi:hypothetical protein